MRVGRCRQDEVHGSDDNDAHQHEESPAPPVHGKAPGEDADNVAVEVTRQEMALKSLAPVEVTCGALRARNYDEKGERGGMKCKKKSNKFMKEYKKRRKKGKKKTR